MTTSMSQVHWSIPDSKLYPLMGTLTNKRVLLGVTGGIAAYKCPDLVRRLRERGAEVRVVMTAAAAEFVAPLALQAVSGHPVRRELLDAHAESGMGHIELARWADLVLVAPASADFIARAAQGRADDLLSAVVLAAAGPRAVAPAMNQQMWANPATQDNLRRLAAAGLHVLGPASGDQACGEVGPGRMLEPVELADAAAALFISGELDGLNVLVTSGPTYEAIDPVRGLTNRSSGRMGHAVAAAAMEAGARVTLISGPTAMADPDRVATVRVTSALEMRDAVMARLDACDVFIGVAAVADYRPAESAAEKIKKGPERMALELVRNPDILAEVAAHPKRPFTVGFAAETRAVTEHARAKLLAKGADLIAANRVGVGTGIGTESNALVLIDRHGEEELPEMSKPRLARELIHRIAVRLNAQNSAEDPRFAHRV
jgi:phosphopantothenoylcysteine decarboxylase/phosphopantothenate--cysteine ligase